MLLQDAIPEKKISSLSMTGKIGYIFGDLGNCFILGLVNSF